MSLVNKKEFGSLYSALNPQFFIPTKKIEDRNLIWKYFIQVKQKIWLSNSL